jgi:hypothetical protein
MFAEAGGADRREYVIARKDARLCRSEPQQISGRVVQRLRRERFRRADRAFFVNKKAA